MIGKQMFAMPWRYVFLIKKAVSGNSSFWYSVSRSVTPTLCYPTECSQPGSSPWSSPGKNTEMGCHFLLQEFLVQALYIILLGSSRRGKKAFPESAGS